MMVEIAACVRNVDCNDESDVVMTPLVSTQEIVENVLQARSGKMLVRISKLKPESVSTPVSTLDVNSLLEVVQYCTESTRMEMSYVNRFFYRLVQSSRTTVDINCSSGWVATINHSPLIESISLLHDGDPEDLTRFCTIIRNDGFPSLRSISLRFVSDHTVISIVGALADYASHLARLHLASPARALSFSLEAYFLAPSVAYALQEALSRGLSHALRALELHTDDVDGLATFFKIVDLSDCRLLDRLALDACPLQARGFELLLRSLWPNTGALRSPAPLRALGLGSVQAEDCGLKSLALAAQRGALTNLETLDLGNNALSRRGAEYLAAALRSFLLPNLRRLVLTNNNLGAGALAGLFDALARGACALLAQLEAEHTGIAERDVARLAGFLRSPFAESLARLNLSLNPLVTGALPQLFAALREGAARALETLFLEGLSIAGAETEALAAWLRSGSAARLKHLLLKSNLLDEAAFCLLLRTLIRSECPRLQVLDFSRNLIGGFEAERWNALLRCDGAEISFEQVDYSFNPLTDADMDFLLRFMRRFSRIERSSRIAFCGNAFTAHAIEAYCSVLGDVGSALQFLSIDSCTISGCGRAFRRFLCSPAARQLEVLVVRDCCLTQDDLELLCQAFEEDGCPALEYLQLDGNSEVGDAFVDRLLGVIEKEHLKSLSGLELAYTSITVTGLKRFVQYVEENPYTRLWLICLKKICVSAKVAETYKETMKQIFHGTFSI